MKKAFFAGGCFWCIASVFDQLDGVKKVISGYAGGQNENPTYQQVKMQLTTHRETICIEYDEKIISYGQLLDVFIDNVDPFDDEGQFIDKGFSYTLAIFYLTDEEKSICLNKINKLQQSSEKQVCISVLPYTNFYNAEDNHQDYAKKNKEAFAKELEESGRKEFYNNKDKETFIRKININELNDVMDIINDAKVLLGKNSLQWQQGYPNEVTMANDINNNNLFGIYSDTLLIGVVALVKGIDKSYTEIFDGNWIIPAGENDLVIHRIAVRNGYHSKKIGQKLMNFSIEYAKNENCNSIKADTHIVNKAMQHLLLSNGFEHRGTIYLKRDEIDNSRLAYEKIV